VCVCVCVCVRASRLGYVSYTYFSKIWNSVTKLYIIRVKFYFQYSSQFNTKHSARKFHSLWIPLLLYIASFYFENKLYFINAWDNFLYQNVYYFRSSMISDTLYQILNLYLHPAELNRHTKF